MSVIVNSDRLDREMARRGWTSADLARTAGLSAATIATARHGRPISARTVAAIARALAGAPPIDDVDGLLL
jgi:DNA-binding Xre family transcriptional regulator